MSGKPSVWWHDDEGFRRAIDSGDLYLFSTRVGNSDAPQVNFHAASCGVWQRTAGSTAQNKFTGRYYKGTDTDLLRLWRYVEKGWPNRPKNVCGCVRAALDDALATAVNISATPAESRTGGNTGGLWTTLLEARNELARKLRMPPESIKIAIST